MTQLKSDIQQRVVNSTLWSFGMRAATSVFGVFQTVVLARLLMPEDFGIFGIAIITIGVAEALSNLGMKQALIQRKGNVYDYLNTLWTVQILRGLLLSALIALASGPVARFFGEPSAAIYILASSLIVIINAFNNPAIVLFQKEINFRLEFWFNISGTMTSLIVGISAAYLMRNPWALVIAVVVAALVRCIASFIIHPYRPRPELNRVRFGEMFGYGKWLMGANILKLFILKLPDIIVGKVLGVAALGLFQMAGRLGRIVNADIYNVVGRVLFPAFSEIQTNPEQFKGAYLKSQRLISFIVLPATGLMFILAERMVNVFLGDKWLVMVPTLQAFALLGCMQATGAFAQILKATGKPRIITFISLLRFSILVAIVYPMVISWGMLGGVLSIIIASSISYVFAMKYGLMDVGCSYKEYIGEIFPNLAITLLSTFLVYSVEGFVPGGLLGLSFLIVFGVTTYILGSLLLDWMTGKTLVFHLKTLKSALR